MELVPDGYRFFSWVTVIEKVYVEPSLEGSKEGQVHFRTCEIERPPNTAGVPKLDNCPNNGSQHQTEQSKSNSLYSACFSLLPSMEIQHRLSL